MRRVDEPVEPLAPGQPPRAFRWRGRRYVVHAVLTHWVETGAWWTARSVAQTPVTEVPDAERELWRVETGSRGRPGAGVLDLCHESTPGGRAGTGGWSVRHVYD